MGFCGMTRLPRLEGEPQRGGAVPGARGLAPWTRGYPYGNLPHELTLVLVRQRTVQGGSELLSDRQLFVS